MNRGEGKRKMAYDGCDYARMCWRHLDGLIRCLKGGEVSDETADKLCKKICDMQDYLAFISATIRAEQGAGNYDFQIDTPQS